MNGSRTHRDLLFIQRQNCTPRYPPSPLQTPESTHTEKPERDSIFIASAVFFLLFFWVEMEQRREKLSEFDRFHIIQFLKKNNIQLNKKRKLQADELGLPKPKQKCCDQSCPSQQVSKFDRGLEAEEKAHLENESEPDSTKDSNIRNPDSDSISMFLEPEKNLNFSMDNLMGSISSKEEAGGGEHHTHQQNNETEEDRLEQSITDEELEELLYSYGLNQNRYTISSATWTILHQEAQSGPRKATIDQEFEHYFSMLNL